LARQGDAGGAAPISFTGTRFEGSEARARLQQAVGFLERGRVIAHASDIDRLFQALGDPKRRAILDRLSRAPDSVSHLAAPLGITVTAVAQHLQLLEDSGLVRTEKVGRVRTCRIDEAGFGRLEGWIAGHRQTWSRRGDRPDETPVRPDGD
jgi:DNA-binding transcriptional ArsR family regulator